MSDKDNYTHAIIAFRRPREAVIPEIDSDVKLEKDTSHNLQKKYSNPYHYSNNLNFNHKIMSFRKKSKNKTIKMRLKRRPHAFKGCFSKIDGDS